ncbi:hypothetical protein CAPTEDRAFT_190651 [Capitella teleta]|uniref:THAP-type domain-containing protein n=1 Tax=Capitella teleta TaxID=283909 RepID=R7TBH6_CAPTE|nr:hypothetical protein CAPTEDRAFT_190651 [Capitella teleta]|eukprot:ELT88837.1 hypothetical protein CAPTEDRAFT_190651 [Capitella teleta]
MDGKKCSVSVEEGPEAKNKNNMSGMTCCWVIICSANCKTMDERTRLQVLDAVRFRERCLKWIANLRKADLSISNVKNKKVCSKHFEQKAYICSTDIAKSLLLQRALPTIVNCRNPLPQEYVSSCPVLRDCSVVSSYPRVKRRRVTEPEDLGKLQEEHGL